MVLFIFLHVMQMDLQEINKIGFKNKTKKNL